MKKIFIPVVLALLLFAPMFANAGGASGSWDESPAQKAMPLCGPSGDSQATGLVPCGVSCSCTIENFFLMLLRIFNFIVWWIATPLAIIMLTVGGIMMMLGAMNPNLFTLGKNTLWAAIIGLALVFGAWVIINFILGALGYQGNWSTLY